MHAAMLTTLKTKITMPATAPLVSLVPAPATDATGANVGSLEGIVVGRVVGTFVGVLVGMLVG